jgi:hypothetical protein
MASFFSACNTPAYSQTFKLKIKHGTKNMSGHPKSVLNEWCQRSKLPLPRYTHKPIIGASNSQISFLCHVTVNGRTYAGRGESKAAASAQAAQAALTASAYTRGMPTRRASEAPNSAAPVWANGVQALPEGPTNRAAFGRTNNVWTPPKGPNSAARSARASVARAPPERLEFSPLPAAKGRGLLTLIIDCENRRELLALHRVATERWEQVHARLVYCEKNSHALAPLCQSLQKACRGDAACRVDRVIVRSAARDAADLACVIEAGQLAGSAAVVVIVTGDSFGATACDVFQQQGYDNCYSVSSPHSLGELLQKLAPGTT